MDFRNIKCINSSCIEKNITMNGAGGQFGSRVEFAKVNCPECNLTLAIMPIKENLTYSIQAQTEEEIIEERIKKEKEKSELELARKINDIKNNF